MPSWECPKHAVPPAALCPHASGRTVLTNGSRLGIAVLNPLAAPPPASRLGKGRSKVADVWLLSRRTIRE